MAPAMRYKINTIISHIEKYVTIQKNIEQGTLNDDGADIIFKKSLGNGTGAAGGFDFQDTSNASLLRIDDGGIGEFGATTVGQDTGWTFPTGTATKGGWDTTTATTQDVAETVKALLDYFNLRGTLSV